MANIYHINMTDLSVTSEEPSEAYKEIGGRGLTSGIVASEVPPTCHPLSAENKLIFAPGLLTGTGAPCGGRLSAGAKSPLTGGIKESNSGGMGALALASLDIKALIFEGKPAAGKLYRLVVNQEGVKIQEADNLAMLGNYDTVAKVYEEFGDKVSCLSIGPAGEMKATGASIAVTDVEGRPTRHCGRGGLGAVMGSKGVKVIVIEPVAGHRMDIADPETFKSGVKKLAAGLKSHAITGEGLPTYGTNVLTNVINEAGGLPTRNFSQGKFEGAEKISGERQHDIILQRGGQIAHACQRGCVIKCSRTYNDKDGKYLTKGPEYETIWAHGSNCCIDDLDAIAVMDRMEDDLGLDTIETGAAIGVAMEAGIIPFGDAQAAIGLLKEVSEGTPLGRLIASGAETLGKAYGVDRVPTVKGQSMPAYDPRAIQGIGVTYATSTMGADHTAGYVISQNILGVGGKVDPLSPEGQVELSRNTQIATAAVDAAGLCLFITFATADIPDAMDGVCEMLSGLLGREYGADDFTEMGKAVLTNERKFNIAAGFSSADDRLPWFCKKEPVAPHNITFKVTDEDLDEVYNFVE